MASTLEDRHAQGIPAALQQLRNGIVPIPDAIAAQLLPSLDLSLRSMLEFVILISQNMNTVNDISSFLQKGEPSPDHIHGFDESPPTLNSELRCGGKTSPLSSPSTAGWIPLSPICTSWQQSCDLLSIVGHIVLEPSWRIPEGGEGTVAEGR
jgi:hypothetical protein